MLKIGFSPFERRFPELFRVALSEESDVARTYGIETIRLALDSFALAARQEQLGEHWLDWDSFPDFMQWVAESSMGRTEAAHELSELFGRYSPRNERRLNIAEEIGRTVFCSIRDKKFEGLHTPTGILNQVSELARERGVRGGRDHDTLRKIWKTYRGVVHFGMALDYCEDNPDQKWPLLLTAKMFRRALSKNCPKGTKKTYVDQEEQIDFYPKSIG